MHTLRYPSSALEKDHQSLYLFLLIGMEQIAGYYTLILIVRLKYTLVLKLNEE